MIRSCVHSNVKELHARWTGADLTQRSLKAADQTELSEVNISCSVASRGVSCCQT